MIVILGYFLHPVASVENLLYEENEKKWVDGIIKWILIAIISTLFAVCIYRVVGVDLNSLSEGYYGNILQGLLKKDINQSFIWLVLVGVNICEILYEILGESPLFVL